MGDDKPQIFCYLPEGQHWKPDVVVCALSEDGFLLAAHVSSNESFAKSDIGVTNPGSHHHRAYLEHYPDGYELVWVEGPIQEHPQGGPALDRNHDKHPKGERAQI